MRKSILDDLNAVFEGGEIQPIPVFPFRIKVCPGIPPDTIIAISPPVPGTDDKYRVSIVKNIGILS